MWSASWTGCCSMAYEQRASDIHLEPRRDTGGVRFRIDGVMQPVYDMPAGVMAAVTSRLKILGRLDVAEKRRPQDGRLKTRNSDGKEVELRISTMPTAFGEKMVMRIFNPEVLVEGPERTGLRYTRGGHLEQHDSAAQRHPAGHRPDRIGKTTTLYSSLKRLATPQVNVCTIEDPIELVMPAFNQMQVQHNIELDFAAGVRTLLRQDPDIIMIGEIRDLETAQMAVQAALTGHLVLSTLHTNDAPAAVTRLLELGVPYYLIRSTLIGVIAQRLIRTYCPHCVERVEADPEQWKTLMAPWKAETPDPCQPGRGLPGVSPEWFPGPRGHLRIVADGAGHQGAHRAQPASGGFAQASLQGRHASSAGERVGQGGTGQDELRRSDEGDACAFYWGRAFHWRVTPRYVPRFSGVKSDTVARR